MAKNSADLVVKKAESILPKKCLFYFKMYINAKSPKAFAYAYDSQEKVTCRFSSASKNQARANEVALASCQKSRKQKKIVHPCKIYHVDANLSKTQEKIAFEKKYLLNLKAIEASQNHKKKPKKKVILKHKKKKAKVLKHKTTSSAKKDTKTIPQSKKKKVSSTTETKTVHNQLMFKKQRLQKALKIAIANADLKTIKKLIAKGADINTQASDKSRALFVAVAQGDINFTKTLLRKKAKVFFRNKNGNNLLIAAIMSGKPALLKLMLEQRIDPNLRCEEGNTPLHFALMMFDDKMMKILYHFGARDNIKNNKGKSVKDLAKEFHIDLKRVKR